MAKQFVVTRTTLGLCFAMALIGSACTSGEPADPPVAAADQDAARVALSLSASAGASGQSEIAFGVEPDLLALEELWAALWDASGAPAQDRATAITQLGGSVEPTAAQLLADWSPDPAGHEVHTHPVFEPSLDGTFVVINDCILYEPDVLGATSYAHSGTAVADGTGGWAIASISHGQQGCIPAEVNRQILEHYQQYWDASRAYRNPPNPLDPAIRQTTTGDHRTQIVDLVELDQQNGWSVIQDELEFNPEVTGIFSSSRVLVTDCVVVHPNDGVFDAAGVRVDGTSQRLPGERDVYTTELLFEGGQWRAADITVQLNAGCTSPPTSAGLPIVGDG